MKKLFLLTATLGLAFVISGCSKKTKTEIAEISYKKEDSIDMFKNCKDKGGLYIRYKCNDIYDGARIFEYAANKDLYMYNYYTKVYTDLSDPTKCVTTVLEHGEWVTEEMVYANTDGITKEDLEEQEIDNLVNAYLFYFSEQNYFGQYTLTKTTAKVIGRTCDKYTYTVNDRFGIESGTDRSYSLEYTESIYVDRELGFCLGEEMFQTLTYDDDQTKKEINTYFMCVELKLKYDVVIPTNK